MANFKTSPLRRCIALCFSEFKCHLELAVPNHNYGDLLNNIINNHATKNNNVPPNVQKSSGVGGTEPQVWGHIGYCHLSNSFMGLSCPQDFAIFQTVSQGFFIFIAWLDLAAPSKKGKWSLLAARMQLCPDFRI